MARTTLSSFSAAASISSFAASRAILNSSRLFPFTCTAMSQYPRQQAQDPAIGQGCSAKSPDSQAQANILQLDAAPLGQRFGLSISAASRSANRHVGRRLLAGGIEARGKRIGKLIDMGDGDVEAELVDRAGHRSDALMGRTAKLQGLTSRALPALTRVRPSPPPRSPAARRAGGTGERLRRRPTSIRCRARAACRTA